MAARKEIIDFIEWERKNPEASILEVSEQSLKVVEIYSERKADTVTLVNDLLDLVVSYKIRGKHDPKTAFDYELVITSLIQSATDWNVILTEDEIKRFENVKVCDIKNLAEYIRTTYKPKQPMSRPDGNIMDAENQPNPTTGDEDTIGTTTSDGASVEKTKRKRGRPITKFEDYVIEPKLLPLLENELAGKFGKEAAKIIIACHEAGWLSSCPTAASIARNFDIPVAGLKEPIRCHYHYIDETSTYEPFTDAELKPIIDRIRKEMEIITDTEK